MTDLRFSADVHDESVNILLDAVIAASDAGETHIRLLITTCGGDLNSAFAGYDHLRLLQRERDLVIETVALGFCLSSGVVLLQAGKLRYATPHTLFMLHQPEQYPWSEEKHSILPDELMGRVGLATVTRLLLADILAERTGLEKVAWEGKLTAMPTTFFTAEDAERERLVDAVLPVA